MKTIIETLKEYFSKNIEILVALTIFLYVIVFHKDFSDAIILMLEFIVVMEVVNMVFSFIRKEKLRLRSVIDIFIIFLVRDVIIQTTLENQDYFRILFLLFVILIFFIFRILAIKFSPNLKQEVEVAALKYEVKKRKEKKKHEEETDSNN